MAFVDDSRDMVEDDVIASARRVQDTAATLIRTAMEKMRNQSIVSFPSTPSQEEQAAEQRVTAPQIAADTEKRTQDLLSSLISLADTDLQAPQMRPVGIDTPEERQRLAVVQLLTGDTALTGSVAQVMEDSEFKAAQIEFQNAVLRHELDKLRLQMRQQATMAGIESVYRLGRMHMDAVMADDELGLKREQMALTRQLTDAQLRTEALRQTQALWQSPDTQAMLALVTSPAASPEERAVARQFFLEKGLLNEEQFSAIASHGERSGRVVAVADAARKIMAEANERTALMYQTGMLPGPGFLDTYNARLQALATDLSPDDLAVLRTSFPNEYNAITQGLSMPSDVEPLAPMEVTPEKVADAAWEFIMSRDVFSADAVAQVTQLPPSSQKLLHTLLQDMLSNVPTGSAPTIMLQFLRGQTITAPTQAEQVRALNAGISLTGVGGRVAAAWFQGKTGMNPVTAMYDVRTGTVYAVGPKVSLAAWNDAMDGKKSTEVVLDGKKIQVRPVLSVLSLAAANNRAVRLVRNQNGTWRVVTVAPDEAEANSATDVTDILLDIAPHAKKGK